VLDGKPTRSKVNVGRSINVELLGSALPDAVLLLKTMPYGRQLGVVDNAQTLIAPKDSLS
jgi:hypothetical protein